MIFLLLQSLLLFLSPFVPLSLSLFDSLLICSSLFFTFHSFLTSSSKYEFQWYLTTVQLLDAIHTHSQTKDWSNFSLSDDCAMKWQTFKTVKFKIPNHNSIKRLFHVRIFLQPAVKTSVLTLCILFKQASRLPDSFFFFSVFLNNIHSWMFGCVWTAELYCIHHCFG